MIEQLIVRGNVIEAYDENMKKLISAKRPVFSFTYHDLVFTPDSKYIKLDNIRIELDDEQIDEVQTYINENVVENVELGLTIQQNMIHHQYLASTDWYVIRQMETGEPIPQEVLENRAIARAAIDVI